METDRLRKRWLTACVVAGLLANLVGGFSFAVTVVFLVIYLTGAALIGRADEGAPSGPAEPETAPYPDRDESETAKPESEAVESGKTESRNAD